MFRHNDLVYRWGGPNVDQNARRAVISGEGTYRVSGNMGACDEFIIQVKTGEMHTGGSRICAETSASRLGLKHDEDFEVILSPTKQPGNWLEIDPSASLVHIRDYYFDWQARMPAAFVIERLDTQGVPKPETSPDMVAKMLDAALNQFENSIVYWNDYMRTRAGQRAELNAFEPARYVPEGVQDIRYSDASIQLADDQALIVEVDPNDSDLWDIQLYNLAWFESLDFPNRCTSLNHHQAHRDADGHIRVVISARDPGVANWLDTEGRPGVCGSIRWWRIKQQPLVKSTVVPLADVRAALAEDTPAFSAEQRAEQRRARAAHVAWRYHT
jgi:hypothetical protein